MSIYLEILYVNLSRNSWRKNFKFEDVYNQTLNSKVGPLAGILSIFWIVTKKEIWVVGQQLMLCSKPFWGLIGIKRRVFSLKRVFFFVKCFVFYGTIQNLASHFGIVRVVKKITFRSKLNFKISVYCKDIQIIIISTFTER